MKRRHLLAAAGTASASLAGCLGAGMPKDAIVRAEQTASPEDASPVVYDELPEAEQRIARTAVTEPFYHACPELPDAVRTFADRFGDPENAYLDYEGTTYGLWIRVEDTVRAGTASPPEDDPGCGFF